MTPTIEKLEQMLAATEGATPGPWETRSTDIYLTRHYGFSGHGWGIHNIGVQQVRDDAAHIANCDPDTIRAILTDLIARIKGEVAAPANDGWIEWRGDWERPAAPDVHLDVRCRDGSEYPHQLGGLWDHRGHPCDIVAYRLATPSPPPLVSEAGEAQCPPGECTSDTCRCW